MEGLIPTIMWTEFLKLAKANQLQELKSCEVTFNGEYLFTFVNGHLGEGSYLRIQTEYLCQQVNAIGGKLPEALLGKVKV